MALGNIAITIRCTNLDELTAWTIEHNDRSEGWTDPNHFVLGPSGTLRFDQMFPNWPHVPSHVGGFVPLRDAAGTPWLGGAICGGTYP